MTITQIEGYEIDGKIFKSKERAVDYSRKLKEARISTLIDDIGVPEFGVDNTALVELISTYTKKEILEVIKKRETNEQKTQRRDCTLGK